MSMRMAVRMPAAWMIARRDKYDVDEDAGGVDDSKYDAARRSTSFVRLLAQLSERQTVGSCTIRRDEYDVNEDGGVDAGGVDDRK